jgi:hypothetical protein
MRSIFILPALLAGLVLTACDEGGDYAQGEAGYDRSLALMEAGEFGGEFGGEFDRAAPEPVLRAPLDMAGDGAAPAPDALPRLIAYRYDYALETPDGATGPLIEAHENACMQAGQTACQIVSANIRENNEGLIYGTLTLRASPQWVADFRAGLEGELDGAGGRILNANQNAEDLSAPIYDLEARLTAQRTLRTRLTALLERENAAIEDLVSVERELARVQGEIEAAEARLRVMLGRVRMSSLTINYATRAEAVRPGALSPLGEAFGDLLENFARGLAAVITFLAFALPWMIVILPVFWLLGRWLRSLWRRRKDANSA